MKTNLAELTAPQPAPDLTQLPPPGTARNPLEGVLLEVGTHLGDVPLQRMLSLSLGNLHVALCLHRVGPGRGTMTISTAKLDALLELLRGAKPVGDRPWLTLSFDDGYDDAAEYVKTRAPNYPDVEWLMFVCPEKNEKRVGFQWDARGSGEELAHVEALRALARLPNVKLGNHTNSHRRQVLLSQEQARHEYVTSRADFVRLYGPQRHFAFPFGTPDREYELRHVELLRELEPEGLIWSTENRPYLPEERRPGAVLPRYSPDGTWTHHQIAFWISAIALRFRMQGSPYRY